MKRWMIAALLMTTLTVARAETVASPDPYAGETKEQRDQRMAWWREARFGMFIHWGVYAVPAGTYDGKQIGGIGEWIMNRGKIPLSVYRTYAKDFTAAKYDPEKWVQVAKRAGMKYIVITSKHHDGFTLFPSAVTNWGISQSPYGKDLLKPLAEACRKNGIRLGFYYSQAQDWNNGGAGNSWDPANQRSMDEYIAQVAVPQVKEILTNYGDDIPAVLWWDTPHSMTPERAKPLIELLKLKPGIIHNNRLGGGFRGDTETPEQHIPATGFKDRDWETCMTLNNTWGFKSYDHNWKSTETLVRNLIDIASKGGNYLLNVGPTAEGEIPQPSIERLEEVGRWMDQYGAAIYGTSASPFSKLSWGRCTQKNGTLFLHVFDWPKDGKLLVPGLRNAAKSATVMGGAKLTAESTADGVLLNGLPAEAPNAIATVIQLDYTGALEITKVLPGPDAKGVIQLTAAAADIHNVLGTETKVEQKYGDSTIGYWTDPRATVSWTFTVAKAGAYSVEVEAAGTHETQFTLGAGKSSMSALVAAKGGYEKFIKLQLGEKINLEAGQQTLTIKPVAGKWSAINLRGLTLAPQG